MVDERKTDERTQNPSPAVQDRRIPPKGVLPRQLQTWLMVGAAFVIVLIILLTGHSQPPKPTRSGPAPTQPVLAPADRIRNYQQQLANEDNRFRDADRAEQPAVSIAKPAGRAGGGTSATQEEARRESQSLFADNVAMSRRPAGQQPYSENTSSRPISNAAGAVPAGAGVDQLSQIEQALTRALAQGPSPSPRRDIAPGLSTTPGTPTVSSPGLSAPAPAGRSTETPTPKAPENPGPGPRLPLSEGSVIETVLLNRLDGTFAGPVSCLVTTPVYSRDRQSVLIPAGARVLGAASPVQSFGDSRLAVSFHRLLMPDGHSYNLDQFKGLDQIGETGLRDEINHHYLQIFGASIAIGALSGLAQFNTRSGAGVGGFGDEYRQAAGSSLANSTSRVLDRYLNILPTITVREGYRIKVYLTNDLALPAYVTASTGGVR